MEGVSRGREVIAAMNKMLAPLRNRVANMVARAIVQLVNDGAKIQLVQLGVLDGETREACERFQEYGFTSVPLAGAEAVVLFVGGRRDHGLVVAVDDRRSRPTGLAAGEVALYTDEGDGITLKRGQFIEVGNGTNQPAALATSLRTELDAIWTKLVALGAHTHAETGGTTGTPSSGAITAATETIASAHVKVRT